MFNKYANKMKNLTDFSKDNILNDQFLLYKKGKIEIYYAPHNEIVNEKAKIFIVGITPGFTQTCMAYKIANELLNKNTDYEKIKKECKRTSRFAGSMRKNLIEMLDDIKLNEKLKIDSCQELFGDYDELLHTTSVIPYPVFINKKNYTGSSPKILEDVDLFKMVQKYFYQEVRKLPNAFYVPLGKSVEEVLKFMVDDGILKEEQCLFGFPHPSGANGHRIKQFNIQKENLIKKVNGYFEDEKIISGEKDY